MFLRLAVPHKLRKKDKKEKEGIQQREKRSGAIERTNSFYRMREVGGTSV